MTWDGDETEYIPNHVWQKYLGGNSTHREIFLKSSVAIKTRVWHTDVLALQTAPTRGPPVLFCWGEPVLPGQRSSQHTLGHHQTATNKTQLREQEGYLMAKISRRTAASSFWASKDHKCNYKTVAGNRVLTHWTNRADAPATMQDDLNGLIYTSQQTFPTANQ